MDLLDVRTNVCDLSAVVNIDLRIFLEYLRFKPLHKVRHYLLFCDVVGGLK